MFVCVYECMYASIAKISNSYKTANKGWVLNFKVALRSLVLLGVNWEAVLSHRTGTHLDSVHTTGSHALTAQRQSLIRP